MLWDLFCRVIDNWGDAGVAWRLAAQLASRGEAVRLWIDDPGLLEWMAPGAGISADGNPRVARWPGPGQRPDPPGNVLVELFGCEPAPEFIASRPDPSRSGATNHIWINLEYLSAEAWCRRSHGLPSPLAHGPGAGRVRYFFYPGFTDDSGGLLREDDLAKRQATFNRAVWLHDHGIAWQGERLVSLFCYEPPGLHTLLQRLGADGQPTRLLVAAGRGRDALQAALRDLDGLNGPWNAQGMVRLDQLPPLSQREFDHLLWCCDLNTVRGEDSLVRALWAGRALLWQPYPQHDGAHAPKLAAFLDWLDAPATMAAWHWHWSGLAPDIDHAPAMPDLAGWSDCVATARARLFGQDDLVTRLLRFVAAKS